MAQADDLNNTSSRWWSLAQTLVWISRGIDMLPRDAEQIANSPLMQLEIERALRALIREFWKLVLGVTKGGMPGDKFRIPCGRRYTDLLTSFPVLSAEPGALSAAMDQFERDTRWQDVECNSDWLKRTFPAPASAMNTSAPVANTEAPAAEPEVEPSPEEAEQQRPPDEPPPKKWRPDEVQTWFKNVKQLHPQKPRENKSAYARRLYEHMKNDFEEDIPWTEWGTLRRRLDDPSTEDD
jgi:hypothetical protein